MRSPTVTPKLHRMAAQAARDPDRVFTTLAPRIDGDLLREAYRHPRQASAPGLDGVTAQPDADHLDETLRALHARRRRGRSQARPGARVGIEKEEGKQRPSGPPTFEDTIGQRAVARRLEASAEHDCADSSYGFRQGRSPHDALHALRARCMRANIGWIVEADVRGSCDSLDRTRLREVLGQRVNAGSRLRLIGKWLRAGGLEDGGVRHPETGVGQGGVMAPVLAHICLQHVLAEWCEQEVQARLQGRSFLMRVAEDCVIGGELKAEARRMMAGLPQRCARYGLTMQPTKTALMACGKPETPQGATEGHGPGAFRGLPHSWTRSRQGYWGSKRRPAQKRLRRTKKALGRWGRTNRHPPLQDQYQPLGQK